VDVIGHHNISKHCKPVLGTSAVDLLKTDVTFRRRERLSVPQEICGNEEIAAGNFNSTEARHAAILM
jgi:hypothetical protein